MTGVLDNVARLAPPDNIKQARTLATLGEDVLPILDRDPSALSPAQAAATVHAAVLVGGAMALQLVNRFSTNSRRPVLRERINGWSYFDPIEYATAAFGPRKEEGGWRFRITDPSVVPGLKHVQDLTAVQCHFVGSVSSGVLLPLRDADALDSLVLENNAEVADLEFVAGHRGIRQIVLRDCDALVELSALRTLPRLESLEITNCRSGALSREVLLALKQLNSLTLDLDPTPSLEGLLRELPYLAHLSLASDAGWTSIDTLGRNGKLSHLELSSCPDVRDISGLYRHGLRHLTIDSCRGIESLIGVGSASALRSLAIINLDQFWDFDFLSELGLLQSLHLEGVSVEDLSFVAELGHLEELTLIDCRSLTDWQPIEDARSLRTVRVSGWPDNIETKNLASRLNVAGVTVVEMPGSQAASDEFPSEEHLLEENGLGHWDLEGDLLYGGYYDDSVWFRQMTYLDDDGHDE